MTTSILPTFHFLLRYSVFFLWITVGSIILIQSNGSVAFVPLASYSSTRNHDGQPAEQQQRLSSSSRLFRHNGNRFRTTQRRATAELIFGGDYCAISDPLPVGTTAEAAGEFLLNEESRNLLFSAGGIRSMERLDMTPEFLQWWQEMVEHFDYQDIRQPTMDDMLIAVEAVVQFPGLKLITKSASGVFVMTNPDTGLPEYHSFSVAEQQRTEGLPPAVWLFNKLTGNADKDSDTFGPPSGKARSVISVVEYNNNHKSSSEPDKDKEEEQNNDKNDAAAAVRYAFSFDVKLQVLVRFPATLMKIIPTPKEKMEEQGAKSILKAVSKDVGLALDSVVQAFVATPIA